MQYRDKAIEVVNNNRKCINLIAAAMEVHTDSVERWLKDNKPNGPLTTITVLEIVIQETGLTKTQILKTK